MLLAAEWDEDSESAHYAAVAKTEIYRLHQARWLECRRDFAQEPGSPEKYHAACEALIDMLASGILFAICSVLGPTAWFPTSLMSDR